MQSRASRDSQTIIRFGLLKILASLALGVFAVLLRVLSGLRFACSRHAGRPAFLIIEPFGLGDIITFEPLVRHLVASNCDVRLCAREDWRVLYPKGLFWVPARIPWAVHESSAKYHLRDYFSKKFRRVLQELRAAGDGCIGLDTRGDIRSVILLYLAGCRRVVTLKNYLGTNVMVLPGAAERVPFDFQLRRWELNLSFLSKIGVAGPANPSSPFFIHLIGPVSSIKSGRIGFISVAPWKGKLWDSDKWLRLAETLQLAGWEIAGLCGPGQTAQAREQLGHCLPVIECGSVQQWAQELTRFAAIISLDSGPMHLADALGLPVIGLFGQGCLPLWAPSNPKSFVVTHQMDPDFVACQPVEANTESGRKFMQRITVAEVLAGLEKAGIRTTPPSSGK